MDYPKNPKNPLPIIVVVAEIININRAYGNINKHVLQ
jgi:hypothetical protein